MRLRKSIGSILMYLLVSGLAVACGGGTDSGSTARTDDSAVVVGTERQIKDDSRPGCTDREYFEKLTSYAAQKDENAFKSALASGLADGTCTLFESGETVFVMDVKAFSGLIQVRRKGETREFWTSIEAVRQS